MSAPLLVRVDDETFRFKDPLGQSVLISSRWIADLKKNPTRVLSVTLLNEDDGSEYSCHLPVEAVQGLTPLLDHFRIHGTIDTSQYKEASEPEQSQMHSNRFGDTEISQDIPALVALARTQARLRKIAPDRKLDVRKATQWMRSDASKRLALAILNPKQESDPTVLAKAAAIRKLALGEISGGEEEKIATWHEGNLELNCVEDPLENPITLAVEEAIAQGNAERDAQNEKNALREKRRLEALNLQKEKDAQRIKTIASKWFPNQVKDTIIRGKNQIFLTWGDSGPGLNPEDNPFLPYDCHLVLSVLVDLYGPYFQGTYKNHSTTEPDWPNMEYTVLTLTLSERCFK